MTDYSKMSDMQINGMVLHCLTNGNPIRLQQASVASGETDYCNSWADAGPIIEEHKISINAHGRHQWMAWKNIGKTITQISDRKNELSDIGKNPLRSAMIVLLMMKDAEAEA